MASNVQVSVRPPYIKLNQLLKLVGLLSTGGSDKAFIQSNEIFVNGTIETRRGRKLVNGDKVLVAGTTYEVTMNDY